MRRRLRGIGPKTLEVLRRCVEEPQPHCNCDPAKRHGCRFVCLVGYGLVAHAGRGTYKATKAGEQYWRRFNSPVRA